MKNSEIEALLYDWHNNINLHNQNKDINFYKKIIKNKINANILIIGAGTGRVAIPLSENNNIVALDKDINRLNRLRKKIKSKNKLEIVNVDIEHYKTSKKFDYIIIPYSTMQNIYPKCKQRKVLRNIKRLLKEYGTCIIDNSNRFKEFKDEDYKNVCSGFCSEIKMVINEYEKCIVHKKYIILKKKFICNNKNILRKKERWNILDERDFEKLILSEKLNIKNKVYGYDDFTKHRVIYFLNKEKKDEKAKSQDNVYKSN